MKAYIYDNKSVITYDEELIDDFIFIDLSKYSKGYPSDKAIARVIENDVEYRELDVKELIEYLNNCYKLIECGGTDV